MNTDSRELSEAAGDWWATADSVVMGLGLPMVLLDESRCPNAATHGLEPLAIMDPTRGPKGFPFAQGLAVDTSHRYRIELVETKPVERAGSMVEHVVVSVVKGVFKHPLPERWWREVHDQNKIVLLVVGQLARHCADVESMMTKFFPRARCAKVPLVMHTWPTGLGTRPQEPRDIE